MKISRLQSLLMLLGSVCVGSAAHAAGDRGPGMELGADVIYQLSQDVDFKGGSHASLDDDFGFAVTFGYRFSSRLELQASIDWQNTDYDVDLVTQLGTHRAGRGTMEAVTPRVVVNYNFSDGPITPYVSAGLGWSFIDTNIPQGRPQDVCWWDPWWGYVCGRVQNTKDIDGFMYQAGVGLRWDLGPAYTLRLGYEKHWVDLSEASGTPDVDQFKLGIAYRY